jgi:bacteriocin-like protein
MTDDLNSERNSENRELRSEELTIDELDSVSGGRMKIPTWWDLSLGYLGPSPAPVYNPPTL